jgi:hypothetical protein
MEHWDGTHWQVVPGPSPSIGTSMLNGVAARAADDVWAVGYYYPSCPTCPAESLLEHWDGATWTLVAAPHAGTRDNVLQHVLILAPDDAWAVGGSYTNTGIEALLLHWDGTVWTIVPSPTVGEAILYQVAGVAADDVWAVGYTPCSGCSAQTLVLHWDGTVWSIVPSPNIPQAHNELTAVTMITATDGWAVGQAAYPGPTQPLILHWDGVQWSIVPTSRISHDILYGVAARAADDVWAVGSTQQVSGVEQTLALHWDGVAWTAVSSPSPGSFQSRFTGVALTQATAWAVGLYRDPTTIYQTLAARYTGLCPTPTITPTPVQYTDLAPGNPFYGYVQALVAHNVLAGYTTNPPCVTGIPCVRPFDLVTRGQAAKIVANAAGFADPVPSTQQTFADVPPTQPFWLWIERLAGRQLISGYTCGGPGEPCDPQNRPYFRPQSDVRRGQLAKIVAGAAGLTQPIPPAQQTFADVPPTQPFWLWIEEVATQGIIRGYTCGGAGEPCDAYNRPYFRSYNAANRGQTSKIVAETFFPATVRSGRAKQ